MPGNSKPVKQAVEEKKETIKEKKADMKQKYEDNKNIWKQIQQSNMLSFRKSIGTKLFTLFFFSIIACVLTVGLMAYSKAKNAIESNVSDASLQTVTQVANNMDVVFRTFNDLSLQLIMDKDIYSLLDTIGSTADNFERLQSNRTLSEKLNAYIVSNRSILGAALIPEKSGTIVVAGNASTTLADQAKEKAWFKHTVEEAGRVNWVASDSDSIITSNGEPAIALTRLVKGINGSGNKKYVLVIEIPIKFIIEHFEDVDLGERSNLAIVNSDGVYIANYDYKKIGLLTDITLPLIAEEDVRDSVKLNDSTGAELLTIYKSFETIPKWKLVGTIPVENLIKDANQIRDLTLITVLVAAVLAILIGALVLRIIAVPLIQLCQLMQKGSDGDLTVRASQKKRADEIGQLSSSFNVMMSQIGALAVQTTCSAEEVLTTAGQLSGSSRKTAIAAQEIAVATEEIANGAASLAVEAEKGSEMTSNINEQMQNVINANQEMVQSAVEVEQASEQGTSYMNTLIEKTGMTEEMTRSMVEKVDSLKGSTGSIVQILDVLTSIMQQTNILSLNAAIEAARAGTAGRGFMVVADEIRKLAEQSRQSIEVVGQITENIRIEIGETVEVLTNAYPIFQEQISSVKEANLIFLTVQGQMGQFVQKLENVTSSISELDNSQTILADAMTSVSAVAEQSSATSEEVASLSNEQLGISDNLVALSEKLDAVSRGLKETLTKFKIE